MRHHTKLDKIYNQESIPISITIPTIIIVSKAVNYIFCNRSFANRYNADIKQRIQLYQLAYII